MNKPDYDVIVVGGGPSGVAAALAAARNGSRTLLIESNGYLGGTVTHSSLPAFCPYGNSEEPVIQGIGLEILEALKKETQLVSYYQDTAQKPLYSWYPIDTEALKRILDEIVLSSGCELLLHAQVTACEKSGKSIHSLTYQTAAGSKNVSAGVYIDCTGNAALASWAGCRTEMGDENGDVQSGTLCFKIANFDTERFIRYAQETGEGGNLFQACARAIANHAFPEGETKVAGISFPSPGVAALNFGHIYGIDPLDASSLTRAEIEGRKKLGELLAFLRRFVPGAENAVLVSSGPAVGIRESRRVVGRYVLTREDFMRRADFDDAIAYYCYPIDVHPSRMKEGSEWNDVYYRQRYQPGEAYGIPYRCLTPADSDNLLVAGKIISCDRAMLGSVRVVPCCFATGQAAGTAAAMAVRQKTSVPCIDAHELRIALSEQGCYIRKH